ncbi:MAG: hypothetical protein J6J23_04235 [Clostridia bacterium]|nr:hypothetical protein [Clostridia bacterium]
MEISDVCKEMLERLKKNAGDKVVYGIDVISLAYGIFGDEHEIYKAMVGGQRISTMVGKTIKPGGDKFKSVLKARLLMLCQSREKEIDNQTAKEERE